MVARRLATKEGTLSPMQDGDQANSNERAIQYIETEIAKCDRAIAKNRDTIESARAGGEHEQVVAALTNELQSWLETRDILEELRLEPAWRGAAENVSGAAQG